VWQGRPPWVRVWSAPDDQFITHIFITHEFLHDDFFKRYDMAITSTVSPDGNQVTIYIQGRFDFSSHQDFRSAYEKLTKVPSQYRVDLQGTTYLDSSALGMLLLLRDYAGGEQSQIHVVNCSPDVKKILLISNFEQLFDIE
jgi:anti-anti-sigma factor